MWNNCCIILYDPNVLNIHLNIRSPQNPCIVILIAKLHVIICPTGNAQMLWPWRMLVLAAVLLSMGKIQTSLTNHIMIN